MKVLFALAAVLVSGGATAQSLSDPQPSMNMPNSSTLQSSSEGRDPFPSPETAAQARERLVRAIALREEAAALLEGNGGVMTRQYRGYVNRKARLIMSSR